MKLTGLTNAFGTVTAVLTFISGVLVSLGCTPGAVDFAATCTVPWLSALNPSFTAILAGVFGFITFVLKAARPGGFLHSMFGSTAVVVPLASSGVGTVTKAQVDAP
jgi:hypothetical protein